MDSENILKPRMIGWLTANDVVLAYDASEQEVLDAFVKLVSSGKPFPSPAAGLPLANDRKPTAAVALENAIQVRMNSGKTKSQALYQVILEEPLVYQAYRVEGGSLALDNTLPENTRLSPNGQRLHTKWPVHKNVLAALGLDPAATREDYEIYRVAEETEITPEIAAVIVRQLVQFGQITNAFSIGEALAHLQKHHPEIYKLALEVRNQKRT